MKWYRHDTNAHGDVKIKKLRMRYGMEGYGLYWYLLELIAENVDQDNITFILEDDAEIISHETGLHLDEVQSMMTYMVQLNLFEENSGVITCLKLAKRLNQSMTSNPQMRKVIEKIRKNHDGVMTKSCLNHDGVMTESRKVMQDKTRLDKNKNNSRRFTPPTITEIAEYVTEKRYNVDAERFWNFYESKEWMIGKNKMKKWKAAVATWNTNGSSGTASNNFQGKEI